MPRSHAAWVLAMALGLVAACGGAHGPGENDIWHEPALRPGRVAARSPGERAVLARLAELPPGEAVVLEGETFRLSEPYAAASGRTCRRVDRGPSRLLACQMGSEWTFVPDVFATDERVSERPGHE